MPTSPSPRSSPAPPSPRSRPVASSILPDRSTTGNNSTTSFVPPWRRPTLQPATGDGRRPSVQFVPQVNVDGASPTTSRSSSAQPPGTRNGPRPSISITGAGNAGRRLSSPPPPAQFRASVSFDTFSNPSASDFSLTLNRKHRDYEYTRRSRTFLCGTDTNEYSDTALEWLIDELVDDGDEVVCLRVVEKDSREAIKWAGGQGEKGYRREAERFLEAIEKKNTEDRAISLVLEFSVGKVQETIQQMIRIYEPAMLVVGTRGRSLTGYQGLLSSGSVSKYCLQYSPVPVIVVRPSSKREAKKRKRLQDPSRTGYRDILDKSDDAPRGRGWHLLDAQNRMSVVGSDLGALGSFNNAGDPDHEARMVAEAIGYRANPAAPTQRPSSAMGREGARSSSLSRITSTSSTITDDGTSPMERVLQSPSLRDADSPPASDDELDDDEDIGALEESTVMRPEDEALQLAYERAQKVFEDEQKETVEREKREKERKERSASRGVSTGRRSRNASKRRESNEEGGGAAVLGVFEQLNRGMK